MVARTNKSRAATGLPLRTLEEEQPRCQRGGSRFSAQFQATLKVRNTRTCKFCRVRHPTGRCPEPCPASALQIVRPESLIERKGWEQAASLRSATFDTVDGFLRYLIPGTLLAPTTGAGWRLDFTPVRTKAGHAEQMRRSSARFAREPHRG